MTKTKLNKQDIKKEQTEFEKECDNIQKLEDIEFSKECGVEKEQREIYRNKRLRKTIIEAFINKMIKMLIVFGFPLVCYYHPLLVLYLLSVLIMCVIYNKIEEENV